MLAEYDGANISTRDMSALLRTSERLRVLTIPPYTISSSMDADDVVLANVCQELNASAFISTFYTRLAAHAENVKQILLIHDMVPELLKWDLSDHQWRRKRR